MKGPKLTFTFHRKEFSKKTTPSLPPLKFFIGSIEKHPRPPFIKLCQRFISKISEEDKNGNFKKINENDSRYAEIIKHPMDFQKIKEKLSNNKYPDKNAFKEDVDLIWQNCIQFNDPTTPIYLSALKLREYFNELWNIHTSLEKNDDIDLALRMVQNKEDILTISKSLFDTSNNNNNSTAMELFKFQSTGYKRPTASSEKGQQPRRKEQTRQTSRLSEELANTPLSAEEKGELAFKIDCLMPALLGDIVDILRKSKNLDLKKEHSIPFSEIDTKVLREIEQCAKEAKRNEAACKRMYQQEPMPAEEQLKTLQKEYRKIDELLKSKKFTGTNDSSDTDTSDSSDNYETSSSEVSEP